MATITFDPESFIPSASATYNSFPVVAGESLTAGDFVYRDATSRLLYKADNSTAAKSTVIGIACQSVYAGQRLLIVTSDTACAVAAASPLAQGRIYAMSATAGKVCDIADVSATADIYLIALCQAVESGLLSFNFQTERSGIQND